MSSLGIFSAPTDKKIFSDKRKFFTFKVSMILFLRIWDLSEVMHFWITLTFIHLIIKYILVLKCIAHEMNGSWSIDIKTFSASRLILHRVVVRALLGWVQGFLGLDILPYLLSRVGNLYHSAPLLKKWLSRIWLFL